ncbi:MAG: hypothetical protein WKG01_06425 [Kofleriaceae bacterium]
MKLERNAAPRTGRRLDLNLWAMAGVLAAMWLVLAIAPGTRGTFLTQGNIATLLSQYSVLLIVAVGMTFVILIRGIDLSAGATVALTGVVAALVHTRLGFAAPWAILAALVVGAAIGAWHGLWSAWLGVPAFIVTLAGFKAYRGAALVASDATSIQLGDELAILNGQLPVTATWAVVLGVLVLGLWIVYREARRRAAFGLEPLTVAAVALRMAGQVLLAGLVLGVFGETGVPVPVLIAGAVAIAGVFVTAHAVRAPPLRDRRQSRGRPALGRRGAADDDRRLHDHGRAHRDRRHRRRRARRQRQRQHAGLPARARRGHRRRDRWDLDRRRPRLGHRHRARHAGLRDARERDEPPAHRLQLAARADRRHPAARRPGRCRPEARTPAAHADARARRRGARGRHGRRAARRLDRAQATRGRIPARDVAGGALPEGPRASRPTRSSSGSRPQCSPRTTTPRSSSRKSRMR